MEAKNVLVIVAVAMLALVIGQVQAETIEINGTFKMYKPGTDILVVDLGAGDFWVNGIGLNLPLSNGGPVTYDDGTTGTMIDCHGWISPITLPAWRDGADVTTGGGQLFQSGYEDDGTSCLNAFTGWNSSGGTLAESSESLGNIIGGATYTLAAMVSPQNVAPSGPLTLALLADGVIIPSSSAVTPTPESQIAQTYQVISRTYDATATAPYHGQALTIRVGTTPPHTLLDTDPDKLYGQRVQFDNITLDVEAMNTSPAYDETVMADADLELSWTNLPSDSNDVWVDVWFGTEPNELHPGYDMTLVVDAGENTESAIVDASVVDTYYWRIDSYLNGADNIDDANMLEGSLLLFHTVSDLAPTVEIVTLDQMTWTGEGVPLDSTVTDDATSALTIEWTADLPTGIFAAYSPGNDVADTTVTLTKELYTDASIINAGFEADQGGDGYWGSAAPWEGGGNWNPGDAPPPAGYEELGDGYTGSAVPEGNMCGWTSDALSQVLAETLAADTQYELTVQVGNSKTYEWTGYNVQLLAGGTVLAEDVDTVEVPFDSWALVTVQFDSAGVDPELVGQPLEIRLRSMQLHTADYSELNFDDVRLTADPGFIPTGVQTVTMTVTVGDVTTPTSDTASIEIDVYDDACHVARAGLGRSAITDFDENCITGIEELVVMVMAWLDDYSSTGPIDRP